MRKRVVVASIIATVGTLALSGLVIVPAAVGTTPVRSATTAPVAGTGGAPTVPPVQLCGKRSALDGPSTPPSGAVSVRPGENLNAVTQANPAGTTFWLAPGTHTLDATSNAQVITKTGNSYVGAPGAVLDGQKVNQRAFGTGWPAQATGVTIKHLTVRNFVPPHNGAAVNAGAASGWVVERNTLGPNAVGKALHIGSANRIRYNCITANGQAGFGTYRPGGVTNVIVTHNEITGNNTENWEARIPGCGCTAGGKFWEVRGAVVTDNWVHDNRSSGLWADTNNIDFLFERNLIENNDGEGLFYEISYNGVIRNNTLRRNALVKGREFAARADTFPVGAIYISESGGDSRLAGSPTLEIDSNVLSDNWGGVVLWEKANRFCGSPVQPGTSCTPFANRNTDCVEAVINNEPHYSNCRWKTQNVKVHDNLFEINKAAIGCTTNHCGRQGIISNWGGYPSWSPYRGNVIKDRITFASANVFSANTYVGSWRFTAYDPSRDLDFAAWRSSPYNQDAGSTMSNTRPSRPVSATPAPAPSPAPASGPAPASSPAPGTPSAGLTRAVVFRVARPNGNRITLQWVNPPSATWSHTVVRRLIGTTAPGNPTDGVAVYTGRGTRVTDRVKAGATYRYAAFAYDRAGRVTRTAAPRPVTAIARPSLHVANPATRAATALPFRVRWNTTGATTYRVQYTYRTKVGTTWLTKPWMDWRGTSTTAGSRVFDPRRPGRTLYFRALARDRYGNPTYYSSSRQAIVPLDDTSPALRYSTGWSTSSGPGRWLGGEHATRRAGATITSSAAASGFVIIGTRCSRCGTFQVYVDGVLKASVSTYRSRLAVRQTLYTIRLPGGVRAHRLEIRAVGAATRPWTRVDAIGVIR